MVVITKRHGYMLLKSHFSCSRGRRKKNIKNEIVQYKNHTNKYERKRNIVTKFYNKRLVV